MIVCAALFDTTENDKKIRCLKVSLHLVIFCSVSGASVAQWSERSPFTSEVAGSILSENVLNVTRTQCSTYVRRFSLAMALRFPPTGKLTGWIRINTAIASLA